MATSEILVFAEGPGANLELQAAYAADPLRTSGNVAGIAKSALNNKALLQSSLMAASLAKFIADNQGNDVVDTVTPAILAGWLTTALASVGVDGFQNITNSGNFTVPADVFRLHYKLWGGGGGGGGVGATAANGSGGGGGGGYSEGWTAVTPGQVIAVVIGAGGTPGGPGGYGGTGGTSSFGSVASAAGGTGGGPNGTPNGGTGGTGSLGTFTTSGGYGGTGAWVNGSGGMGGGSYGGPPQGGGWGIGAGGIIPGGGGAGTGSTTASAGGPGASGKLILEW